MQPIHLFILKKAKPVSSDLKLISPRNKYMIPVVKLGLLMNFFRTRIPVSNAVTAMEESLN